jgi:flagellin-like hook-associated protein FlgL
MRVTNMIPDAQYAMQESQQALSIALQQVSTGLRLNSAVTLGTSGANGTNSTANRSEVVTQVQGVLTSVIGHANSSFQGAYLFGGSSTSSPPFVQASLSYSSAVGSMTASTPLTANSLTTISDAATGQTFSFKAPIGATVGTLTAAISSAVTAGTLSAGTNATISPGGNLQISSGGSSGIVVSTNDAVLGSMAGTAGTEVANFRQDQLLRSGQLQQR